MNAEEFITELKYLDSDEAFDALGKNELYYAKHRLYDKLRRWGIDFVFQVINYYPDYKFVSEDGFRPLRITQCDLISMSYDEYTDTLSIKYYACGIDDEIGYIRDFTKMFNEGSAKEYALELIDRELSDVNTEINKLKFFQQRYEVLKSYKNTLMRK